VSRPLGVAAVRDVYTGRTYTVADTECAHCRCPMKLASLTDAALAAALTAVVCDDCRRDTKKSSRV